MNNPNIQQSITNSRGATAILTVVFCLVAYIIYIRCSWLLSQPWPLDYDGFYYLQEVKHRLLSGTGYYHQTSVFFFILTHFTSLLKFDLPQALSYWIISYLLLFSLGLALFSWDKLHPWLALVF